MTINHQLGREEALRRIKSGIGDARVRFGDKLSRIDETWTDNHLDFTVRALGQQVNGTLDVLDDQVRAEFHLPVLLAMLAKRLDTTLRDEGTKLLERR